MTTTATAAVLHEPHGQFSMEQVTLDDLKPDEILVRIEASGICHTDIAVQDMLPMPAVLGHEGTGVVEQVGSAVSRIKAGERVTISYGSCNNCPNCLQELPYICDNSVQCNFGGSRLDGTHTIQLAGEPITAAFFQQSSFATHAITLERNVVSIDQGLSAQMLAPLGCGIMTGAGAILNTLQVGGKDSLVVFGAGTVGLSAIMAGRMVGAAPLIAVDINASRLDLALELGATHAFNAGEGEIPERVREICPRGAKFSFETSGVEQALNDAIMCLAMAGHCGMVTAPHYGEKYPFSPSEIFFRAANLQGVFLGSAVPQTFLPQLVGFQREGKFPYERLIKTYHFTDINQAFKDTESGDVIKPVLLMD